MKKNYLWQSLGLVLLLTAILLSMGALPEMEILGWKAKPVRMLSDLFPKKNRTGETMQVAEADESDSVNAKKGDPAKFATEMGKDIVDYGSLMDGFYSKLNAGEGVQIAYFGDSFVEGDLMTEELRDLLQQKFGGGGVGWVECSSLVENFRTSVKVKSQGFTPKAINERGYQKNMGMVNMHYSTLQRGKNVSDMKIVKSGKCNGDVHEATLWFTSADSICVMASVNDGEAVKYEFEGSHEMRSVSVHGDLKRVTWTVECPDSVPDAVFYGATLDKGDGVVLDCYSVRGFDGKGINTIPSWRIREFSKRHYDLIILAYGMNCANDKEAENGYLRFVNIMKKDIAFLKLQYPSSAILVVSVTDREQKNEYGEVETMDCIQTMVNAQQKLAEECGVGFYNFYQSMGGYGSMKKLAEKGMANKDYTHISHHGGRLLAKKFYESLVGGR